MHTEVSETNSTIWISGYDGWKKLRESQAFRLSIKAISHESLHLVIRAKVGKLASTNLDLLEIDSDGVAIDGLAEK